MSALKHNNIEKEILFTPSSADTSAEHCVCLSYEHMAPPTTASARSQVMAGIQANRHPVSDG
ncbi:conserved hypothetical protein [Coccidioides posadasii str. Silveira]|uniref:Uncharacterized protein n=1 Tax=Coccidioides posadasii (strain RMSCC 757 / Silveira) TaxID=443226 RepID=E9D5J0_COCPS|nr:conserved hypothetical protein [Coccidioides posadasii str. Silveira]